MGLDTSHGCWHGAYSAFTRFRNELALAAGYKLAKDEYFIYADIQWDKFPESALQGDWGDMVPEDPLIVLLAHSDCDGEIPAKWCLPLAERLEELADRMPEEGAGHFHHPREQTLQFASGLRDAAAKNESVDFH